MARLYKPKYPKTRVVIGPDGKPVMRQRMLRGRMTLEPKRETIRDARGRVVYGRLSKWYIEYRDANGILQNVPGYKDKGATLQKAAKLELLAGRQAEGMTDRFTEANKEPLAEHFEEYLNHLRAKQVTPAKIKQTKARFQRVVDACNFRRLSDLRPEPVENWLCSLEETLAAATRNGYRQAVSGFGNWCVRKRRMASNPFATVPVADQQTDQRRKRRSMTEDELRCLLVVATLRPLADFGRESVKLPEAKRKGRATWKYAPLP